jgi:hypothetical protein
MLFLSSFDDYSIEKGGWIIPRFVFGKPVEALNSTAFSFSFIFNDIILIRKYIGRFTI